MIVLLLIFFVLPLVAVGTYFTSFEVLFYVLGALTLPLLLIELEITRESSVSVMFLFALVVLLVEGAVFLTTGSQSFWRSFFLGTSISAFIGLIIAFFNMKISCGGN